MNENHGSPLSDTATLELIRGFLRAPKPEAAAPIDICLTIHLLNRKAVDHEIADSQLTLAQCFATDVTTVGRSLKRLQKLGWGTALKRRGRTSLLAVNHE